MCSSDLGEATLPVRVSPHVAAGAAFVPFNNPGLRANTLLDGSLAVAAEVAPAVPLEVAPAGGEG